MKLISWNVNGIRAVVRKGDFQQFIKAHKPDIVCLQETKAERGQAEVDLAAYEEYWNSSRTKKGYSGTAIFVKTKINKEDVKTAEPLEVLSVAYDFPEKITKKYKLADKYGDPNAEGRVIAVECKDFFVVTSYTPNSKEDLSRLPLRHKHWDPAFLEYMKLLEKKKPVLFCGDLNVAHGPEDLEHPKQNEGGHGYTQEEREGIDKILKAGYIDSFRHFVPTGKGHYTWWSAFSNARARNVGWRIDYWFVSKKLLPKLKKAAILATVMGSDHCPVVIELK